MRTVVSRTMQAVKTVGRCEVARCARCPCGRCTSDVFVSVRLNERVEIICVVGGVPECDKSTQPPKYAVNGLKPLA